MNNRGRIKVLPPLLVNKIAAGEVVERPASVVKELLDNSIDAGATLITLTIEDGGKRLIRVTDDGCGMTPDELLLAVAPHATSKISEEDDLFQISSMGFRGEALASIASVSHMRLASRPRDAVEGAALEIAGVDKREAKAAGCPPGTSVEIRDLFFNVPARRKFLRAASTETGHINDHFARAALAFPNIAFELTNNRRKTHNLPPAVNRMERIAKFYGRELADALLVTHRDERGVSLEAYLAPPARSRATAQWQFTFVNQRYIRDKYVQHAIREAYRGLIEHNRHAVVFLFIDIDPRNVDVNVHPTKTEVRWADPNLIHSQVLSVIRETLQHADLTPALGAARGSRTPESAPDEREQQRMREELAAVLRRTDPGTHRPHAAPGAGGRMPLWGRSGSYADGDRPARPEPGTPVSWRDVYRPVDHPATIDRPPGDARATPENATGPAAPPLNRQRAVQMHNLYLVVETEDGILIIDQHALHERVMYEKLKEMLARGPLEAQRLLLPETVNTTASQVALLGEYEDLLKRLGVEVRQIGPDAVAIHTFPALIRNARPAEFVRDLADQLESKPKAGTEDFVHDVLDMMACKAAVKAGDPLTPAEVDALIAQRHLVEKSSNCPHGRPTTLRLTKEHLNRQFKRT